jgi:hypothetical protein
VLDFEYRKMRKIVDSRIKKNLKAEFVEQDTQVFRETRKQLDECYSRNELCALNLVSTFLLAIRFPKLNR